MNRRNVRPNVIAVTPDSSKELKERVYRLRYQIYVEEMKYDLANSERMLQDKYDNYSTSFLAEIDGEDVGTIRYTAKTDGPLESEQQHESWRSYISSSERDPDVVCELARFLVRQDRRGTRVGVRLMYVARLHCMAVGTFRVYHFGKAGRVAAFYRKFGSYQYSRARPLHPGGLRDGSIYIDAS